MATTKKAISIHALVKRATRQHDCCTCVNDISIHALVKRATKAERWTDADDAISIHALVKRATHLACHTIPSLNDFNPRPREEGDSSPPTING